MGGEIEIKINRRTGEIKVEGHEYMGAECIHDMDELQMLLGLTTIHEETKPEYVHDVAVLRARR